jgi:hypothetical protein
MRFGLQFNLIRNKARQWRCCVTGQIGYAGQVRPINIGGPLVGMGFGVGRVGGEIDRKCRLRP